LLAVADASDDDDNLNNLLNNLPFISVMTHRCPHNRLSCKTAMIGL